MYLESWIQSTEKDANMRIGLVCSNITISSTIGDSRLNTEIKIMMFKATVESLPIYKCPMLGLDQRTRKELQGNAFLEALKRL